MTEKIIKPVWKNLKSQGILKRNFSGHREYRAKAFYLSTYIFEMGGASRREGEARRAQGGG